ncbi:glycoside hydrolase family 5 /Carbohydrate-binding module family 1 [Cryphonectria parasitica EP155]|uniref:cellulase n=1 Tax=Cryphonectria parasitica (strain ATCC 38755 / EP155) TaxID=660469 RepID=A0A9P5CN47_CRYP1|nr:glycoside hydrolase family 5 /Carbohydrate-binding module family 1 [Cryphonectria parasitica EP155]KAF3763922.1 glycoside hydrolase family 5 /Carbohydrate-binding module family 1 [Cryphonectria parasitica EP155]
MKSVILALASVTGALAQGAAYAQCGGTGWTGATTCVSGYVCTYENDYYSQCLPGTATTTATTIVTSTTAAATTSTTAPAATSTSSASGSFKWFGVDESCAEFGSDDYPGTWGIDFIFPDNSSLQTLLDQGFNIFRVPFAMERMLSEEDLTSALAPAYLANYTGTINYITENGGWAIIDPHNYGRFYGVVIDDTSAFQTFWENLAGQFKDNSYVIFDTNNEYHDEDQSLVFDMNQAAIDGIRAAGATSQYIAVEGNAYTGAWSWTEYNTDLASLTDSENKILYEMHQYLDSDSSGTSDECVNSTIGVDRVTSATQWLQENGKVGILGEFAGGPNDVCYEAVEGMLDYLQENSDVWLGALWWAGGPWWGDTFYAFEPPSGEGYVYYDSLLEEYVPS